MTTLGNSSETVLIPGNLQINGSLVPVSLFARSAHPQEPLAEYPIPWDAWRVWDAYQTNLPGTPAADDLGLIGGTFGTGSPSVQTSDLKATTTSQYARCVRSLPVEYEAGQTVVIRLHAGMLTTVADASALIDVEVYRSNDEAGIGSDLCATAATTINSLTLGDKDFTITPASLGPGDQLDIRVKITVTDAATATAVKGIIGAASLLCDIKG